MLLFICLKYWLQIYSKSVPTKCLLSNSRFMRSYSRRKQNPTTREREKLEAERIRWGRCEESDFTKSMLGNYQAIGVG